jgi:hypothetical protein
MREKKTKKNPGIKQDCWQRPGETNAKPLLLSSGLKMATMLWCHLNVICVFFTMCTGTLLESKIPSVVYCGFAYLVNKS